VGFALRASLSARAIPLSCGIVYTHVMNRPGIAVKSPADALLRKRKAADPTSDTEGDPEPAHDKNDPPK